MAKKRTAHDNDLPPGVSPVNNAEDAHMSATKSQSMVENKSDAANSPTKLVAKLLTHRLDVPFITGGPRGYRAIRVDVRFDNSRQADTCREVLDGLQQKEAKLNNGRFVRNGQDVFKWMLEQIAAAK